MSGCVARIAVIGLLAAGCSKPADPPPVAPAEPAPAAEPAPPARNPDRNAYFGDLHVHTQYSFDAFVFGTRSTPDAAYEYARGGALVHPAGFEMKLARPLDFLGVTDHSEYLGMLVAMDDPATAAGQHPIAVAIRAARTPAERLQEFQKLIPRIRATAADDDLFDPAVVDRTWQDIVAAAERHNDPGRFTTFVGYEFTASGPARENLHRNVIFQGAAAALPFTSRESTNPEDLWDWLDAQRAAGIEALAIPHNSNGSDGMMFQPARTDGSPFDAAYAEQRMRNEPLVEVTQVKGTSDTHPALSANDEWADFELMPTKVASTDLSRPSGSYVREALLRGVAMQAAQGFNPWAFGLIGSSDTHVGAGSFDEDNYWSKVGIVDATPVQRGSVPMPQPDADGNAYAGAGRTNFETWSAAGLVGVWAEANTRDDLYAAMRRKETFATSGPRIPVRFFAGWDVDAAVIGDAARFATLYRTAVPMGGTLRPADPADPADPSGPAAAPTFYIAALRDPDSAPLQRVQVVKGWVEGDAPREQVYDVACSDGGVVDPATHRCPDNGATVDLADCSISTGRGAAEFETTWRDPAFRPDQHAVYYVRVLENPTCRWSTWDALRAGVAPRESLHATIQERAWSSPIWYVP